MRHNATLMILDIVVVEKTEILGERWFQSWVTLLDVEWIAVIGNIEQIGH